MRKEKGPDRPKSRTMYLGKGKGDTLYVENQKQAKGFGPYPDIINAAKLSHRHNLKENRIVFGRKQIYRGK